MFLPGESHGRGSLAGCRSWGRPESDRAERAHTGRHSDLQAILNPFKCTLGPYETGSGFCRKALRSFALAECSPFGVTPVFTGPRKVCGSRALCLQGPVENRPSCWRPGAHPVSDTDMEHPHSRLLGSAGFSIAPLSLSLHNTAGVLLLLLASESFRAQPSPLSKLSLNQVFHFIHPFPSRCQ